MEKQAECRNCDGTGVVNDSFIGDPQCEEDCCCCQGSGIAVDEDDRPEWPAWFK